MSLRAGAQPRIDRSVLSTVVGGGLVLAIGIGTLVIHLARVTMAHETGMPPLLGTVVPLGLSLSIVIAGAWLLRNELAVSHAIQVSVWCLGGVIGMVLAGGLLVQLQSVLPVTDQVFFLINAITGGAVIGLLVGVYDLENRRARDLAAAERERTAEANQRLRVLNRVLRHDMLNAINVIQGNAEELVDDLEGDERARLIEAKSHEIAELGERARDIASMIESDVTPEPADLAALVRTKCERIDRGRDDVVVDTTMPDTLTVYAHDLIGSAVDNVIGNAIEHGDREPLTVDVSLTTEDDWAVLQVRDDGPGIPEREIDAFDEGIDDALEQTSGLGLWLVHWIVDRSEGEVAVAEREPRGTVVTIRLPLSPPE